jgi:hypothetical protein
VRHRTTSLALRNHTKTAQVTACLQSAQRGRLLPAAASFARARSNRESASASCGRAFSSAILEYNFAAILIASSDTANIVGAHSAVSFGAPRSTASGHRTQSGGRSGLRCDGLALRAAAATSLVNLASASTETLKEGWEG